MSKELADKLRDAGIDLKAPPEARDRIDEAKSEYEDCHAELEAYAGFPIHFVTVDRK